MNLNKLALCGAVAGSIAAMGCGGPSGGTDSGPSGSDSPAMAPVSQTYIVGTITIPAAPTGTAMDHAPGFNLDEKVSDGSGTATCEDFQPDYINDSGETGVDNQLVGSLLGLLSSFGDFDVQMEVDGQISSGSLILAMQVNDINSFTNDSSVTLDLFLVDAADCATSPCMLPAAGVTADQHWVQRAGMPLASGLAATIEDGVLSGGPLDLPLSFTASGTTMVMKAPAVRISQLLPREPSSETSLPAALTS